MRKLTFINKSQKYNKQILIFENDQCIKKVCGSLDTVEIFLPEKKQIMVTITNSTNKYLSLLGYIFFYINGIADNKSILELIKYEKITFIPSNEPIVIEYTHSCSKVISDNQYNYIDGYNKKDGHMLGIGLLVVLVIILYSLFVLILK